MIHDVLTAAAFYRGFLLGIDGIELKGDCASLPYQIGRLFFL